MISQLSNYNKTLELQSIVEDQINNIFGSEQVFQKIVDCFLSKLKKENDKQLAIRYLISIFPNNIYIIRYQKNFARQMPAQRTFTDYGLEENQKIHQQYDRLHSVRQNKDWERLNQLLEDKAFCQICRFQNSLDKQKLVFEKLKHHSFRIIDIMRQCDNSSFQLNSITLKNLIFFFFLPDELQINNQEKTGLYQILGEILCNSWISFEYHYSQLQMQNYDQNQIKSLQNILTFLQKDLQLLYDSIQQVMQLQ